MSAVGSCEVILIKSTSRLSIQTYKTPHLEVLYYCIFNRDYPPLTFPYNHQHPSPIKVTDMTVIAPKTLY